MRERHHEEDTGMIPAAPPRLEANGRLLATGSDRLGRLTPTPAATGMAEIRAALAENGYVWLKRLLEPGEVVAFRAWVFGHLARAGVLRAGSDPAEGIAGAQPHDRALSDRLLMALVRSAAFEGFCAQPRLSRFMDELLGGISYLHRRKLMRFTLPGTAVSTPAHYDLVYLRGGTDRIVTAWIPIGDVPLEQGGLIYLRGSDALGRSMERDFAARAQDLTPDERISAYNRHMSEGGWVSKDLPAMAERFDTAWLTADYEAGDVVLHSPYMIHASTNNVSPTGRIRLSTDIRFQNVDDEIDARWAQHWSLGDML
jgi:ectoine hydroxylase-related dioxygenase (phytanoyl-CoA dioxygenase family)